MHLDGPAIIEESSSTTLLQSGDELAVNQFGHLVLRTGGNYGSRS
jgi:hypothetical protein